MTATLDRAQRGDEQAFRELVAPHLGSLHLHCYRMLGSLTDAEDLLQETLLAAWRGLGGYAGRGSFRAWLYRIATTRCLNAIRDGRRRLPAEPVPPFDPPEPSRRDEVTWLQPYPDAWLEGVAGDAPGPEARAQARETVELAFVAALQRLPPRQTAALLLCDVLGFSIADAACTLDTSTGAIKGALQRARRGLARYRGYAGSAPAPGSPEELALARRFADAYSHDDVDGVVTLLSDRAWLAMPPAPHVYQGPVAIAAFLRASARGRDGRHFQLVPTRANGQPAFGCYLAATTRQHADPVGLVVLSLGGKRISAITRFLDPELPRVFRLAASFD